MAAAAQVEQIPRGCRGEDFGFAEPSADSSARCSPAEGQHLLRAFVVLFFSERQELELYAATRPEVAGATSPECEQQHKQPCSPLVQDEQQAQHFSRFSRCIHDDLRACLGRIRISRPARAGGVQRDEAHHQQKHFKKSREVSVEEDPQGGVLSEKRVLSEVSQVGKKGSSYPGDGGRLCQFLRRKGANVLEGL